MRRALLLAVVSLATAAPALAADVIGNPVWSPDGTQIGWSERSGKVWIAEADGSSARAIANIEDAAFQLAWVRGDMLLALANYRLFSLPLSGGSSVLSGSSESFAVDAAGTRLAWGIAGCPHCSGPLQIYSLADGSIKKIGGDSMANRNPTFSPDGRRIAFDRSIPDMGSGGIWITPTTGGALKRLTKTGGAPFWSPDGRWILFCDGQGLSVVAPNGKSRSTLRARAQCHSVPWNVSWSPDSRSIALSDEHGLIVIDLKTRRAHTVTTGPHPGHAWSPDSKRLLVTGSPTRRTCSSLWVVSATGSERQRLRPC